MSPGAPPAVTNSPRSGIQERIDMTRTRPFAIALVATLALGLASHALAQKDTTHPYSGAVTGTITALDATTITVERPNDDGGSLALNGDTEVTNDAKTIKAADLKKGWSVVVSWDCASVESKSKVAKRIEATDAPWRHPSLPGEVVRRAALAASPAILARANCRSRSLS
jgi:hypothetical protein